MSRKLILSKSSRTRQSEPDPDNPALSATELRAMRRVAPSKRIRWQLGLSQEEFARRFEIPIGTLRDWEQGRSRPDRAANAYLKVISREPSTVGRALGTAEHASATISSLAAKGLSDPRSLSQNEVKQLAASILIRHSAPLKRHKAK